MSFLQLVLSLDKTIKEIILFWRICQFDRYRNMYELINHAIHSNKNPPIHMRSFYKILAKSMIPNKFIRNKEGRNIMNKQINVIDEGWRPPGRLK